MIFKGQNKGDNAIIEEAIHSCWGFHGMQALTKLFFIYKIEALFKYVSTYYLQNTTCATWRDANWYVELFFEYKVQFLKTNQNPINLNVTQQMNGFCTKLWWFGCWRTNLQMLLQKTNLEFLCDIETFIGLTCILPLLKCV